MKPLLVYTNKISCGRRILFVSSSINFLVPLVVGCSHVLIESFGLLLQLDVLFCIKAKGLLINWCFWPNIFSLRGSLNGRFLCHFCCHRFYNRLQILDGFKLQETWIVLLTLQGKVLAALLLAHSIVIASGDRPDLRFSCVVEIADLRARPLGRPCDVVWNAEILFFGGCQLLHALHIVAYSGTLGGVEKERVLFLALAILPVRLCLHHLASLGPVPRP